MRPHTVCNLGVGQEDKGAAHPVPGQGRHRGQIHTHWRGPEVNRAEGLTI